MTKRVIIGGLVALALIGAGIAIGAHADGDWGPRHEAVVVSGGAPGSGAADAGQTIVINGGHDRHGFFFFPFGLLFLGLVIFLVVSLVRRGRGGGPCRHGGGPGSSGGPKWLEDWHRRAHEDEATTPSPEQSKPA